MLENDASLQWILRPYVNGRDLSARSRGVFVIDFGLMDEADARRYAVLFDFVRSLVKPERDANRRESYSRYWWRFGEPRRDWRSAVGGLGRFIATVETSRRRFFTFLDAIVAPDNKLVCIASEDAFLLGVLSSDIHTTWALAAGARLGVGNDPVYVKSHCFDAYPFPPFSTTEHPRIAKVAEELDAHRKAAIDRDEAVTMSGMYNVVEKLRSSEPLTAKERKIHELAACGVLKDLHDEIDALVAKAYGWEWPLERDVILERLVALHDERVNEEKAGNVRWLRPDYQIPRLGKDLAPAASELDLDEVAPAATKPAKRPAWPADVISQIGAIKKLLSSQALAIEEVAGQFSGSRPEIVRRHLDILEVMGEVQKNPDGRYQGVA